jgi:hypothetical protein
MGHLNLLLSCIAVISNGVFDVHQT